MDLKINLATRSYINTRQLNLSIVVLSGLLLVGMMYFVSDIATKTGEMQRIGSEVESLEGINKGKVNAKEYQNLLARIAFANGLIARKSYNWLMLLDRLETVVPDGVAITSIQPEQGGAKLKLTGVATSFAGIRRFMENLEDAKFINEVYLLGQSETKVSESQKGTTFSITCKVALK